ncbi:MAG: reverse transcriptase family protein [Myxococcota bacterium]
MGRHKLPVLPVGADPESDLAREVRAKLEEFPESLPEIQFLLRTAHATVDFDAPLRIVSERIERDLETIVSASPATRRAVCNLAGYVPPTQGTWWARTFANDAVPSVRSAARAILKLHQSRESFLRRGRRRGVEALAASPGPLLRHRRGADVRRESGVPNWATVGDLCGALGLVERQLAYLLVASDGERHGVPGPYRRIEIPKRSGGVRLICAPSPQLRRVQRRILRKVLDKVPVHDAAHGFRKGRSVATHAALHAGRRVVVSFDLVDFFPSVHYFRVVGLFASLGFDLSLARFGAHEEHRGVAETLARLCIYAENPRHRGAGFAPQGAPTSPAIANLVCRRMDSRLSGLAERIGGHYSRYADDLTFSFDREPEGGVGRFRWWVDAICYQEGFLVHRGKFRVQRQSQRQHVTGVVVNERPRVSRRDRRRFRAILHNCRTHGVESQARGRDHFKSWLRGYAAWIHAVDPAEGARLLAEVAELLGEPDG